MWSSAIMEKTTTTDNPEAARITEAVEQAIAEVGISSEVPSNPEGETDEDAGFGEHATADLDSYPYNDLGNAERFRDLNGAAACYVPDDRRWYRFNEEIWEPDASGGKVRLLARRVPDHLNAQAAGCEDDNRAAQLRGFAKSCGSKHSLNSMISLAGDLMTEEPSRFDADPCLLSFRNGTLDLKSLTLREHRAEDYISKQVPFDYDPAAEAPRFQQMLEETQPNPEHRMFLQRLAGLSLLGHNREEKLVVFYGSGGNGKSKLIEALAYALGPTLSAKVPESTIVRPRTDSESSHQSDLAKLEGNRLVFVDETDESVFLNCARVKALTGAEGIEVRKAHAPDSRTVPVTWLFFISTNYKPKILDTSYSIWRRLILIEFPVKIEKPDLHLKDKLRAEAPGILAWAVEGLRAYHAEGLAVPESCQRALDEYRAAEDLLGEFIEEWLVPDPEEFCFRQQVFNRYTQWCEEQGVRHGSQRNFNRKMESRGFFMKDRGKAHSKIWFGCRLRDSVYDDSDRALVEREIREEREADRREQAKKRLGVVPLPAKRAAS
jgi:putative DNA primase/helicase